jgi:hypothetical protein
MNCVLFRRSFAPPGTEVRGLSLQLDGRDRIREAMVAFLCRPSDLASHVEPLPRYGQRDRVWLLHRGLPALAHSAGGEPSRLLKLGLGEKRIFV